jgi:hypothetical protein
MMPNRVLPPMAYAAWIGIGRGGHLLIREAGKERTDAVLAWRPIFRGVQVR